MDVTWAEILAADAVIALGAVIQASTGLGAGLLVVPLLALIKLEFVPGPVIFSSLALSGLMTYRGREAIKRPYLSNVSLGLVIGMLIGTVSMAHLPQRWLGFVFGGVILSAVLITACGLSIRFTTWNSWVAGAVSGFMGITAAIGAPILALLYQREEGRTLRSTLAFLYLFSSLGMLMLLHVAGRFQTDHLLLGVCLVPGIVAGYLMAGTLAPVIDRGYARQAVLVMSAVSALALIARSSI